MAVTKASSRAIFVSSDFGLSLGWIEVKGLFFLRGEVEDHLQPVFVVLDLGLRLDDVRFPGGHFGLGAQDLDRGQLADLDGPPVFVQKVLGQLEGSGD